jgi:peroxiredoxin
MPNNTRANIELGAQILIAVAVLAAAGVLIKRNLLPLRSPVDLPRINAGEKLSVANVDWQHNKKTLVFFLKKGCVFCTSSAPFYRQLLQDASKRDVKSLAILPDPEPEARSYVESLELQMDTVQTGPLQTYKITGTPTVLFVDSQGIVRNVWFGAAPEHEKEMRDQLIELFDGQTN